MPRSSNAPTGATVGFRLGSRERRPLLGERRLTTLAEQAERDPRTLEIVAFGMPGEFRTDKELDALERAGADQVTVRLTHTEGDETLAELEQLAAAILI